MFIPVIKNSVYNWEEYTLFVPVVSVGNVGQLTADLIISTLCMDHIGIIVHEAITPAVGNNPYAQPDEDHTTCKLASCCEVYDSAATKIMVIQQRAPLIKGRVKSYVKFLSEWIKEKNFYQVVIIGSTFSHERLDFQMQGSPFRIVVMDSLRDRAGNTFSELGWNAMESRPGLIASGEGGDFNTGLSSLFVPGSGIAKPLLEALKDKPVLLFVMFCSEGDNVPDAIAMAQHLNGWVNIISKEDDEEKSMPSIDAVHGNKGWKIPTSWRNFYGTKFDQTLFH